MVMHILHATTTYKLTVVLRDELDQLGDFYNLVDESGYYSFNGRRIGDVGTRRSIPQV